MLSQVPFPDWARHIPNLNWLVLTRTVSAPGFGIERYGVGPDTDVDNDPKSMLAGHDPQLERVVAELMKQLKDRKVGLPSPPPSPVKTVAH